MQGILLISSGQMARALYDKTEVYFGHIPEQFDYFILSFASEDTEKLEDKISQLDNGDGVIILADERYPEEIMKVCNKAKSQLITGINQPLLMNILMDRMNGHPIDLTRIINNGRESLSVMTK